MSTRAERERLNRILADETYGPALVRLNQTEQREILDLISANRGREARTRITELDSARRTKVKQRSAARRATVPTGRTWTDYAQWVKNTISNRVGWPTDAGRLAADARARAPITPDEAFQRTRGLTLEEFLDQGSADAIDSRRTGEPEWSPFWYHY